jgi:tetratricopeptide (TPR) repeat protein
MASDQQLQEALRLHQAGQTGSAEALYRQVLLADPDNADALHLLGLLSSDAGRHAEALDLIGRAIVRNSHNPAYYNNLSLAQIALGRWNEAIESCSKALALRPEYPQALCNMGNALDRLGRSTDAEGPLRRAIALSPSFAEAHFNLGNVLGRLGRLPEAIAEYRQAITARPKYPKALLSIGHALREADQPDAALTAYQQAVAADPGNAHAHYSLGATFEFFNRFDEAVTAYERAIEIAPNLARAHWNLALVSLARGNLARGFEEYEVAQRARLGKAWTRDFTQPAWDGSTPDGRRVLIYAQLGFGDTMQMIRYAPLLGIRGARVIIECHRPLVRLLAAQKFAGMTQVIAQGEAIPEFDAHCGVMSLPRLMGTQSIETIPATVPYLSADTEMASRWRIRLGDDDRLQVGLVWAGHPGNPNDRQRSMELAVLAPLADVPGVRFISLQKGPAAGQAAAPPAGMTLMDWTGEIDDFADTAALIDALDFVICVETAVAHLAGAMGKQVCLLLCLPDDWHWMIGRSDSPWYPTMRLFRQDKAGDWRTPIRRVADALRDLVETHGAR